MQVNLRWGCCRCSSCSGMSDSATPWTAARQASLSTTNSRGLLRLKYIESVVPSDHIILCCHLLLPPSIFPSIRVFSDESALCIKWPKYGASASTSVLPMNIQDWFPLGWTDLISLESKGLLSLFKHQIQKHHFFSTQFSFWSNSHIHTWLLEKPKLWLDGPCQQSNVSAFSYAI